MTDTSHDIRTLNSLIATTIDSIDGYEESAKAVDTGRFAQIFQARANERRQIAGQLRGEVKRLGGNPEDDGTFLAGAHRAFLNLKATVTTRDDKAVVAEVERGEDHIKTKFEEALRDDKLSPETRSTIESAFQSVKSGHDQMSDLKHGINA
jgi:uncharacterized protein (TIGR02284 family)